ncbi:S8 family serine peptidase [Loktanella sp. DJP18]|uniref:S8 family serine peptidase n=1 Tax=Loktanella sp. DJP18 TaxID=3409788 RepID=UPI003BB5BF6B
MASEHLGLISRTTDGWSAPLWDDARGHKAITVAIIDSGLDPLQPSLASALVTPQIDFGPRAAGAVYRSSIPTVATLRQALATSQGDLRAIVQGELAEVRDHTARTGLDFARLSLLHDAVQAAGNPVPAAQEFLAVLSVQPLGLSKADPAFDDASAKLADLDLEEDQIVAIATLVGQMSNGYAQIDMPDPAQYFGTHATACAGLVGGRPPRDRPHEFFSALPYHGVNPFCRIASYATPYSMKSNQSSTLFSSHT